MLQPFKQLIENPEDIPMIPPNVAEYLQARLNPGYLMQAGTVRWLHEQGYSENHIMGFLAGVQYAIQTIDDTETIRKQLQEDDIG